MCQYMVYVGIPMQLNLSISQQNVSICAIGRYSDPIKSKHITAKCVNMCLYVDIPIQLNQSI